MSIVTRLLPQNFQVTVARPFTPIEHRAIVSVFAAAKLAEVQAINRAALGFLPDYKTTVDGQVGRSILGVKLDGGEIVYDFAIVDRRDVIVVALDALRNASPVVSGRYRDSHTVYINGSPVEGIPDLIKPFDEVMIANPVPYARRIEIGRTKSGRSFVVQVDNRIYERVVKNTLVPRFGNQAKIVFEYATLRDAATVNGGLQSRNSHYAAAGGRRIKRRQSVGSQVQSPAILIQQLAA